MKRIWYYGVLVAIALFVASMAVLWRDNTASAESDELTSAAATVFLVFIVCGPSLLAKQVFGMLGPVEQSSKERRRLRAKLKAITAEHREAKEAIGNIVHWHAWYVAEYEHMRNAYTRAYNENVGKPQENPYVAKRWAG
ncbi:MAG: hypothetical protein ACSLFQ_02065 [Thermoanaerobaculia bacterium]